MRTARQPGSGSRATALRTQGQEFYRALVRRGVDTEMLILPRTPHGPREPKLLMEVTPRILSWFEKYMPGEKAVTDGAEAGTR